MRISSPSLIRCSSAPGESVNRVTKTPLGGSFDVSPFFLMGGVDSPSQAINPEALTLQAPFEVGISWPFATKVTSTTNSSDVKENRTMMLPRLLTESLHNNLAATDPS